VDKLSVLFCIKILTLTQMSCCDKMTVGQADCLQLVHEVLSPVWPLGVS